MKTTWRWTKCKNTPVQKKLDLCDLSCHKNDGFPLLCVFAESLSQELWRAFPRWRRRLTDGSVRKSPPCEPQSFMGREALKHPVTSSGWTRGLMDQSSPPNIDSYHFYTLLLSLQEFKKKKKRKQKRKAPDSRKGGVTTVRLCKENKTTTTKTFFETLLRVFRRKQTLPQDWTETWTTALWFIFILFFCFCCFSPFCIFLSKDNYHFREGTSPGCVFV